jgi:small-conductance mechanosensitive channel
VSALLLDPVWSRWLLGLALLCGSYLAARVLSWLFGTLVLRAAAKTPSELDDRLVRALRRPLTAALFLVGAYASVHQLPVDAAWHVRFDRALFVVAALVVTVALVRAWTILTHWYATESRLGTENGLTREFTPLLAKLGRVFLVLVATIAVLQHFGIDVNSLVVSLGVGSLAVGLAAQSTLANMFAGFTLLVDRPFAVGERIRLASGEIGDVEWIGMRSTRLRTLDGSWLVIPNSVLVNERVLNLSRPTHAVAARVELAVPFGADLERVKELLAASAAVSPRVDPQRPPRVLLTRFTETHVQLQLVFWAREYTEQGAAQSEVSEEAYRRLVAAGIAPFPGPQQPPPAAGAAPGETGVIEA